MIEGLNFPSGFLWGTATSAHQVEGNNVNSDWYRWEQKNVGKPGGPLEPSGAADDSYNRYSEDFQIVRSLNQNAHRISLEWARIEPEEGKFSDTEVQHYRKVLGELKNSGIKTFVTLHHFTNPAWFADRCGWEDRRSIEYFRKYVEFCVRNFSDLVDFWMTINEPSVYTYQSYIFGSWPPNKKNLITAAKVFFNLAGAHKAAYRTIKSYNPEAKVSFAHQAIRFNPYKLTWIDKIAATVQNFTALNFSLFVFKPFDYIALNYYVEAKASALRLIFDFSNGITDMGWPVSASGLYQILMSAKAWDKDIYITENGISVADDNERKSFILEHVLWTKKAIEKGARVKGYLYWSLLDNFEWDKGYGMKFGIVEVERDNGFKRNIRESGLLYGEIARNNGLEFLKDSSYFTSMQKQAAEKAL